MAAISYAFHSVALDEWADLPIDDDRELVDGRLVEAEMTGGIHECVLMWLAHVVVAWGRPRGARAFMSGLKFGINAKLGRIPDMSIFLFDQKRPPVKGIVRTPPSIAVEVVSPSANDERRDRIDKFAEYERFGVRWYWIIDPDWRTFEIFELSADGKYRRMVAVTDGTIDPVPGCADLTIDVSALWRDLAAYIAETGEE